MKKQYYRRDDVPKIDLEQLRSVLEEIFGMDHKDYSFAIENREMDRNDSAEGCAIDSGEREIVFF